MSIYEESVRFHEEKRGKIEIVSRVAVETAQDMSLAYTPGVAQPCLEIKEDPNKAYLYTRKWNTIAVVSDGTAVLGLGDIGPLASLPVMEGKAVLFKSFGDVDAFPILINSKDIDEIVETVERIALSFGGINLEDIGAPRCFEIERRLKESLDIPVFHDDQHGTAIVTLAGLVNALKLVGKKLSDIKIIVNGAGAAGSSVTRLLLKAGAKNIIVCDRKGALHKGLNEKGTTRAELIENTNPKNEIGTLGEVIEGADVFIGVSAAGVLKPEMAEKMAKDSIVFAMANPTPEIFPDEAKAAGVRIIGTGRSDFPNQVNNVLAFPGIFRGALDVRARDINEEMKMAAAFAIAESIKPEELNEENIIPKAFDKSVQLLVAKAVAKAAKASGVARI